MALPEIDPSRKIIPRSRGELNHPGSCAVCSNSDPEKTYIDFGIYFDYEGNVYICETCFKEAAVTVMGYVTMEEHQALLDINNRVMLENGALLGELNNARPILNAVAGLNLAALGSTDSGSEPSDSNSFKIVEAGEVGEPEVKEPANEQDSSGTSGDEPRDRSTPVIV